MCLNQMYPVHQILFSTFGGLVHNYQNHHFLATPAQVID